MSAGEIGIAALWKPIGLVVGVITTLIGAIWGLLVARIKKNEDVSSSTKQDLASNYYRKDETTQMILLHTNPLKESIDRQTAALDRLCDKLEKLNRH